MTVVTSGEVGGGGIDEAAIEVDGGGSDDGALHHYLFFTSPYPCGTSKLLTSSIGRGEIINITIFTQDGWIPM